MQRWNCLGKYFFFSVQLGNWHFQNGTFCLQFGRFCFQRWYLCSYFIGTNIPPRLGIWKSRNHEEVWQMPATLNTDPPPPTPSLNAEFLFQSIWYDSDTLSWLAKYYSLSLWLNVVHEGHTLIMSKKPCPPISTSYLLTNLNELQTSCWMSSWPSLWTTWLEEMEKTRTRSKWWLCVHVCVSGGYYIFLILINNLWFVCRKKKEGPEEVEEEEVKVSKGHLSALSWVPVLRSGSEIWFWDPLRVCRWMWMKTQSMRKKMRSLKERRMVSSGAFSTYGFNSLLSWRSESIRSCTHDPGLLALLKLAGVNLWRKRNR